MTSREIPTIAERVTELLAKSPEPTAEQCDKAARIFAEYRASRNVKDAA